MDFVAKLTKFLTEMRLLAQEVGNEVFLATMCLIFISVVLFLVMRQANRNFFAMKEEFNKKVSILEEGQKACHEERDQLRIELHTARTRNDELNELNKDSQKRIQESEIAQKTIAETFSATVNQFLDKMK